ncbi:MBL fold metallo-hydrolase [Limnobacter humi]|uniref:MBL fold metallo-hydrolase n=1 Tax=Limnobacter humi TaxID=1778671 RepID=A0ABT1WG93_9BURK|nr:MBL fold metallo-hydrolase [Limnobacter humi]MCQ8895777.1 MBL fold metallo-hydrolase [Limnobacter humi]
MGIERLFEPPTLGQPVPVAPGILWLRLPLPFALDHINVWLIEEAHQYTLVDTGAGLPNVAALWEDIEQTLFAHKPLGRIIVTHAHPDHIGMAGPLARKHGVQVHMSSAEYFMARGLCANLPGFDAHSLATFMASHGLAHEEKAEETQKARGGLFARLVPEPPLSFQRIQHGDELIIGNQTWRCMAGFGHSPEHISLVCESLGVMISGDMLLPTISTNVSVYAIEPEGNPLLAFLKSVQAMATLPDRLMVLPSHGVPFKGIHDRCAQLLRHHDHRLNELLDALKAQPLSARQAISVLFKREMDGHQMSFAMGEAVAHLHYLWRKGLAQRTQQNGVWVFEATPEAL